jgi:hypothetical protein
MQDDWQTDDEHGAAHMTITEAGLPSEFVVFDPNNADAAVSVDIGDAVEPGAMR